MNIVAFSGCPAPFKHPSHAWGGGGWFLSISYYPYNSLLWPFSVKNTGMWFDLHKLDLPVQDSFQGE